MSENARYTLTCTAWLALVILLLAAAAGPAYASSVPTTIIAGNANQHFSQATVNSNPAIRPYQYDGIMQESEGQRRVINVAVVYRSASEFVKLKPLQERVIARLAKKGFTPASDDGSRVIASLSIGEGRALGYRVTDGWSCAEILSELRSREPTEEDFVEHLAQMLIEALPVH